MDDSRWTTLAAVSIAAVLLTGGVAMMAAFHTTSATRATSVPSSAQHNAVLALTIAYDRMLGTYVFTNTGASIPADTPVVVTITNHDPSVNTLFVPGDNRVIGTVGGIESVNIGNGPMMVSSLPASGISHTFTVLDRLYNISVPIPPAPSSSIPSVVTFELVMNYAETTTWACVCHCMPNVMMPGMYGPLVITG